MCQHKGVLACMLRRADRGLRPQGVERVRIVPGRLGRTGDLLEASDADGCSLEPEGSFGRDTRTGGGMSTASAQ